MNTPNQEPDRRSAAREGRTLVGVPVRDDDIEPTRGLRSVAILFRTMAGILILLMVVQVANGLSSTIQISYGVLTAEAVRLVIGAGLLWGAGDIADLLVKSHYDVRAMRILLGRVTRVVGEMSGAGNARPGVSNADVRRGDDRD